MKISVGVLFGGNSVEHEVSVISASQAMHALDKEKYAVVPIYITKDCKFYTGEALFDIAKYKDIPASELRNLIEVTIVEGEGAISDTITYSIETYVNSRLQNSTNEEFKTLLKELMKYSDSARNYFR